MDVFNSRSSMKQIKPFELKDILVTQIQTKGDEMLDKFVPILTYLYQNAAALNMLPDDKAMLILKCVSNMIKCNVSLSSVFFGLLSSSGVYIQLLIYTILKHLSGNYDCDEQCRIYC